MRINGSDSENPSSLVGRHFHRCLIFALGVCRTMCNASFGSASMISNTSFENPFEQRSIEQWHPRPSMFNKETKLTS
jgi:hypothetical protein